MVIIFDVPHIDNSHFRRAQQASTILIAVDWTAMVDSLSALAYRYASLRQLALRLAIRMHVTTLQKQRWTSKGRTRLLATM